MGHYDLYTYNLHTDWVREIPLRAHLFKGTLTITDVPCCKIIYLQSGTATLVRNGETTFCSAPMLLLFNETDSLSIQQPLGIQGMIVYFKPSVINDAFSFEAIASGLTEDLTGTTIYQDYILLQAFYGIGISRSHYLNLTPAFSHRVNQVLEQMNEQLSEQYDDYWPCRSRSYFIELLFTINMILDDSNNQKPSTTSNSSTCQLACEEEEDRNNPQLHLLNEIVGYLDCHLNESITVDDICKKFGKNRNQINSLFHTFSNMTAMNYLFTLRMKLACHLLANTEIPIYEIGERIGYYDANYFTKAFKKQFQLTPRQFRNHNS